MGSDTQRAPLTGRIARFDSLVPIEAQSGHSLPQDIADMIWSRKIMPVIGLGADARTPFGPKAPIEGAAGITMAYAVCPPGTGPGLHAHRKTYETFTVIKGRFEFRFGADGDEACVLDPCDVISVPPGVPRAFRNLSEDEGVLQVVISGGVHDMNDIFFPKSMADAISARSPDHLKYFKGMGLDFETE